MRARRTIVKIDEDKCNGCGQCAEACVEGAIAIVDGKARLISEVYCDGLGACIGECPQGAITTEVREADEFNQAAVEEHLARQGRQPGAHQHAHKAAHPPFACPSATARSLEREMTPAATHQAIPSHLTNWPVQIMLVPPTAPYLWGARLVIAADCTAFAYSDFHRQFLDGRVLLVGCPKLDDAAFYRTKLAQVLGGNDVQDIEVVYMEVPCCSGLVRIVTDAIKETGQQIPLTLTKIGIRGEVKERTREEVGAKRE